MAKGSSFEREVCKRLSLWWTDGQDDSCFWRTSNSGGRATARRRRGKKTRAHCGDLCAVDEVGKPLTDLITFELKRGYSRLSIQDLLDLPPGKKGGNAGENYPDWIAQAKAAHEAAGSYAWALLVRRDQRRAILVFPYTLARLLLISDQGWLLDTDFGTLTVMWFEGFLACVDPDGIRQACEVVGLGSGRPDAA